ncbi:MAG: GldG family protein [candidate division KSB1 bacterium]|nr:GldG family protein [candidate division KSB1 bacterium]
MNRRKIGDYLGLGGVAVILIGLVSYSVHGILTPAISVTLGVGLAAIVAYGVLNFADIRTALSSRSTRFGSNAVLMAVVVLGILILINFVANRHSLRADTTAAKQFSLAEQTRKILKNLDRDVKVTAFYRAEDRWQIESLLKEYAHYSPRFKWEIIDPDQRPAEAKQYNISAYNTIVLECGGKEERITTRTEQDLTNALIKVTRKENKKIYFLTGHGEKDIEATDREGYDAVRKLLRNENYDVEKILLAEKDHVPDDCALLVVAGPKTALLENEASMIRDYLKKGGKALFLLDPESPDEYVNLLGEWGIEVGKNVVVDASGIGRLFGAGPAMPIATQYTSHAITQNFQLMTIYPYARSVRKATNAPVGATVTELVKTSSNAWGETEPLSRGGMVRYDEGKDLPGPVPVAVAYEKEAEETTPRSGEDELRPVRTKTRLVVFGDSDFASNTYYRVQGNGDLFMNAVSWLAEQEDLISIRPKDPEDRRVNLTRSQSRLIFWVTVVLMPLAVLGAGAGIYWKRR